jgi:hypothetical protein
MTHTFKLDGTPADPPSFKTTVLAWKPGDTIPLSARRAWRNERGSIVTTARARRRLLALRSEGVVFPHSRQRLYGVCPVYDVLPPMADRPPPRSTASAMRSRPELRRPPDASGRSRPQRRPRRAAGPGR